MKKWSCKKRWLVGVVASLCALPVLWFGCVFAIGYFNLFHAHEHCSKILSAGLQLYAEDHHGKFPYHTNGFGDALLLLLKEEIETEPRILTAPGDEGGIFKACLANGANVDETKCTRIYIQGLSRTEIGESPVAMVFDAYPTPGGDHFRRPWGEPTRDVVMTDGIVEFIREKNWPGFATNQIERLVKLGLKRSDLEKLFGVDSQGFLTSEDKLKFL